MTDCHTLRGEWELMVKPRRGRAVLVGAADYYPSYNARTDLKVGDVWPLPATLAMYRLDLPSYQRMYADQHGCCAICGVERDPVRLVIDHNHRTGKVRGLLCSPCNTGLGFFKDSPDLVTAALTYLDTRGCYGANTLMEGLE